MGWGSGRPLVSPAKHLFLEEKWDPTLAKWHHRVNDGVVAVRNALSAPLTDAEGAAGLHAPAPPTEKDLLRSLLVPGATRWRCLGLAAKGW